MKLIDKLWNWGHLEGSHNDCTGLDCRMTPEQFADEYGIRRAFIVSYGGNIQPPFAPFAERFRVFDEVIWSVLGDAGSPLPEGELGNTDDILACLDSGCAITGGVVDDFFSPVRMERYPPEVLRKIRAALNGKGLDFWCVLYSHDFDRENLSEYLSCFDGVTFWLWGCEKISRMEEALAAFRNLTDGMKTMLGIYLWDYGGPVSGPMDSILFEKQLKRSFEMLESGETDGVVFCSGTVGDAGLESAAILKRYIAEYGQREIG